jgi:hypothetical protein
MLMMRRSSPRSLAVLTPIILDRQSWADEHVVGVRHVKPSVLEGREALSGIERYGHK